MKTSPRGSSAPFGIPWCHGSPRRRRTPATTPIGPPGAADLRRAALVVVVVALAGFATAAFLARDDDRAARLTVGDGETVPGWEAFRQPPFAPRVQPLVAWTGTEVVVIGGVQVDGDGTFARDGAAYDPTSGAWRAVADLPLDTGLSQPSGLWTGTELLVVGEPCGRPEGGDLGGDEEEVPCEPGGLATLAYDPTSDSWREVSPPPADARYPSALGWSGTEAVFVDGERYLAYGPAGDRWRWLPAVPIDETFICVVDGGVLAVRSIDQANASMELAPEPGERADVTIPDLAAQARRLSVVTLDDGGDQWSAPVEATTGDRSPPLTAYLCGGEGVVVVPLTFTPGEEPGHRFSLSSRAWADTAPASVTVGPVEHWVWTGTEHIAWTIEGEVAYDPATDRWRRLRDGPTPEARPVWAGDRALVSVTTAEGTTIEAYEPRAA